MANELPSTDSSPSVFQMFNRTRRFSLDSELSSLPQVPSDPPAPRDRPGVPKLQKSLTQPQLSLSQSLKAFAPASSSTSTNAAGDLHVPAAIMAPTTQQLPFQPPGGSAVSSVESRNQTEPPSYFGSRILGSLRQELKLFGDPSGRRRASLPNLPLSGDLQSVSESRQLSQVREETEKEVKNEMQAVVPKTSENKEVKPQKTAPPDLLGSAALPKDMVDEVPLKKPSFTKQMMNWFVTPHSQSNNTSKAEFNAVTPTSF